ncbi:type I-MYXAN CRISPR-associated protein Cas6/Cmx6 [Caldichromatium japonicum]|uniref:Type I-MYXAN CRISPR-associated protein Cas6/Cmx6 n=1 Tax=Caldichromatium japonicum TaxID=2699430 RepID=A0A6G7VB48_9GAMM|nr:type I-MYXAN CRISPR-associated protein Cas6/Cmx6 [Caldichromatium japonicum]QIK37017.1 type I-MYXAN CRISPR-associated protein Cas6/Cmx6 [Caldichromatium japonicum]
MFWNEEEVSEPSQAPDAVVDLAFAIACRCLPVDHAYALSNALRPLVPWFDEEPRLGVHSIHVAGSQNGWERPAHSPDNLLMVSRRTKLKIRVPRARADDLIACLTGQRIEVGGQALAIGTAKIQPLSRETTLLARHIAIAPERASSTDETAFLATTAQMLQGLGIRIRKALCGKVTLLHTPTGPIPTRALMLAGLTVEESLHLQSEGLGLHRTLGCGIFIPHKGIDPVKPVA